MADARRPDAAAAQAAAVDAGARRRRPAAVMLRARREAYDELRGARPARRSRALRDEPGYAAVRSRLADHARRLLGPDAGIGDADAAGSSPSRLDDAVDLSLRPAFADRAADMVAAELDGPVHDRTGRDEHGPAGQRATGRGAGRSGMAMADLVEVGVRAAAGRGGRLRPDRVTLQAYEYTGAWLPAIRSPRWVGRSPRGSDRACSAASSTDCCGHWAVPPPGSRRAPARRPTTATWCVPAEPRHRA